MLVNMLNVNDKGKELKAPHHASTTVPRDDHVTTRNIVPTLIKCSIEILSIYTASI
jgi:hypothetical protein